MSGEVEQPARRKTRQAARAAVEPACVERFVKYQGLGNDFVIVDRRAVGVDVDAATAVAWCDRHFGVGADGVLAILPAAGALGRMVVHNADGSIAEMCGNGLRCVAKHLAESAGPPREAVSIETGAGLLRCELEWSAGEVARVIVSMGAARLVDPSLPRGASGGPLVGERLPGTELVATAVSLGNPHLVLLGRAPSEAASLGPSLERHPSFPHRTNVECVRWADAPQGVPRTLEVAVWERGVGLTLACGTGACAAVVAAALAGVVPFDAWVSVRLPGGELAVRVLEDLSQVLLRGPAVRVFEGTLP